MGIFDRFFKKKEQIEEDIIVLADALKWYDSKIEPKKQRLKQKISQTKQNIIKNVQETKQKIEVLQNAELMNPNIPMRARHFMQGNRETYCKKINSFLDSLFLPEELEELSGFFNDFNVQLQNLAKGMARPTQILNEFLSNETRAVTIPLGNIEKEIQSLKETMHKMNLHEIEQTKQKINEVQNKIKKQKELKEEIESVLKEINSTKKENTILLKEIDLLQQDKDLNEAKKQQKEIQKKIKEMKKLLLSSFSIIETAMKKYEHISYKHTKLLKKYLKSPVEALMLDLHLDIINMLSDMKNKIEIRKIEMKARKSKKTIEEINKMTKENLGKFLTEYGQFHLDDKNIQGKINKMDVILVISEKEAKKQKNDNKLAEKMNRMNQLQTELNKINIDLLIKELEKDLGKKTHVKLTISLKPLVETDLYPEQKV